MFKKWDKRTVSYYPKQAYAFLLENASIWFIAHILHMRNTRNPPNGTKQHKMFKKWDKRTVPYCKDIAQTKKQPEGCF